MPRINPYKVLLLNLEGKFEGDSNKRKLYLSKEDALNSLKRMTQQDFGYDVEAWRKYLRDNKIYP